MARSLEPYRNPPPPPGQRQPMRLPERFTRWIEALRSRIRTIPCFTYLDGSPEGVVNGQQGDLAYDRVGLVYYQKSTDTGNTGWLEIGGAGGASGLPKDYLTGLVTNPNSVAPLTQIDFNPGCARDTTNQADLDVTTTVIKDLTAVYAEGSGLGGRPGTVPLTADTWYHCFLIGKLNGDIDFGFDTNVNAVNLLGAATDFIYYRRVGAILTDSSSNIIPYQQFGNEFVWDIQVQNYNAGTTNGETLVTMQVPPDLNVLAHVTAQLDYDSAAVRTTIYAPGQPTPTSSTSLQTLRVTGSAVFNNSTFYVPTDTSSQIAHESDNGSQSLRLFTRGWIDPRADFNTGSVGGAVRPTATEFCPGYTYVFVNAFTWQVNGLNVTNLFTGGRRLKFTEGATTKFGTIVSSNFTGGNTEIVMAMEGGAVLTNNPTEVCFTVSATAWSPIAADPFQGNPIRDIATGAISGTQYWVIVGDGGRLAYSTDAGVNWTTVATGTAENLNHVDYAPDIEEFLAGGTAGVLLDSSNGSTWNLDTASLPALSLAGGNADVRSIDRLENEQEWFVTFNYDAANVRMLQDQGTLTWALTASSSNLNSAPLHGARNDPANTVIYVNSSLDDVAFLSSLSDATLQSAITNIFGNTSPFTCTEQFTEGGNVRAIYCAGDGQIRIGQTVGNTPAAADAVTFNLAMRGAAYSNLNSRLVAVGDTSQIGYVDQADLLTGGAVWTQITSGLAPTANFTAVKWNDVDAVYVAVADNGQILRSSNGLGDAIINPEFTGWTAIAGDPFSGGPINALAVGVIGGTVYWVAVGNGGNLFTSTDAGATWQSQSSGTILPLLSVAYDSNNENFLVGGANGVLVSSTDGTTWTADTTTVPALSGTGSDNVGQILFDPNTPAWLLYYQDAAAWRSASLTVDFLTAIDRDSNIGPTAGDGKTAGQNSFGNVYYHQQNEDVFGLNGATDNSSSQTAARNNPPDGLVSAIGAWTGTLGNVVNLLFGTNDGTIDRWDNIRIVLDLQQFAGQVNRFAYSSVSDRYIAVGNGGEIQTLDGPDFNTPSSWRTVNNPFAGNITDVAYNATDDIFVAVSNQGEICRSVDGIS